MSEQGHSNADNPSPGRQTALAQRRGLETWRDPHWQRLWLTVESHPWRSLAVVPAGDGGAPDFTLNIAVALSRTGMTHLGAPIQVADGTQVALNQLTGFIADMRHCIDSGDRIIVALPPVANSPTASSIAKASDAAVLCILIEAMASSEARQTIKLVGSSLFIGSIIIRSEQQSVPPPP